MKKLMIYWMKNKTKEFREKIFELYGKVLKGNEKIK